MTKLEHILVYAPLEDETLAALEPAARLARRHGASVTVMRVLEEGAWWSPGGPSPERAAELRAFLETSQARALADRVAPWRVGGLDVDVEIRWGTPWLELVRAVLRDGHDLVVKTASGATRRGAPFLGSTALHLIRKCPSAVWVVAGEEQPPTGRMVAAIDPLAVDTVRAALSERILERALDVAEAFEAELHVVAAWRAAGERVVREHMTGAELEAFVEASRNVAAEGLRKALASWGGVVPEPRAHLLPGPAHEVVADWIAREGADLLVLGSLGRADLPGRLIGETAETLVRSVRCSVLALKPPGFTSPVRLEDADARDAA